MQRTTKRSRRVESVDYSECEIGSETEGESVGSEGNTTLLEWEIKKEDSERAWTPITFSRHTEQIGQQCRRLSEQIKQQKTMAKQQEGGIERIFQMFLQMRTEDKEREERRER